MLSFGRVADITYVSVGFTMCLGVTRSGAESGCSKIILSTIVLVSGFGVV